MEAGFKAAGGKPQKGRSPREHPACRGLNRAAMGKGLSEGSKPGSRGQSVRPKGSPDGVAAG